MLLTGAGCQGARRASNIPRLHLANARLDCSDALQLERVRHRLALRPSPDSFPLAAQSRCSCSCCCCWYSLHRPHPPACVHLHLAAPERQPAPGLPSAAGSAGNPLRCPGPATPPAGSICCGEAGSTTAGVPVGQLLPLPAAPRSPATSARQVLSYILTLLRGGEEEGLLLLLHRSTHVPHLCGPVCKLRCRASWRCSCSAPAPPYAM